MILGWGAAVGVCLGVSTVVLVRWGQWWFAISLSVIIAVMMVCYVAVPARLIGVQATHSKRDKLTAHRGGRGSRSGGLHPADVLGRIGLLMLSSRYYPSGDHAGEIRRGSPALTRYADDLVVCCHSRQQAEQVKAQLAGWLEPRGLAFNEAKTRIVPLSDTAAVVRDRGVVDAGQGDRVEVRLPRS